MVDVGGGIRSIRPVVRGRRVNDEVGWDTEMGRWDRKGRRQRNSPGPRPAAGLSRQQAGQPPGGGCTAVRTLARDVGRRTRRHSLLDSGPDATEEQAEV